MHTHTHTQIVNELLLRNKKGNDGYHKHRSPSFPRIKLPSHLAAYHLTLDSVSS